MKQGREARKGNEDMQFKIIAYVHIQFLQVSTLSADLEQIHFMGWGPNLH